MAFVFWKPSVSFLSSLVRRTRDPRPAARQRNGFSLRLEPLESRVLLAATNVDAKILGGSLFVTGYTFGNRDVTISTDSNNPSNFLVTPGANTTVNGSINPASFKFSDVRFNVYVDFLSSFTGFERSVVTIDSKGATLPGSVIVTLQGSGGDTFLMKDSSVRGSVVIASLAGDDTIELQNVLVTSATTVDTSLGRNVTTVKNSTFTLPATFNVGPSGNSVLNVDDSTFRSTFVTVSAGQNNLVNIEQNTALPGATNFNGLAQFSFAGAPVAGGGGTLLLSTANANTKTNFNGPSVIYGATIAGSAAQTSFAQRPTLILSRFAAIDIVTTTLPAWTQNLPGYSQLISTNGGFGPLQFSVSAGALPTGLTLNPTSGLISGTPTASGVSNFTVRVVDANGGTDTQAYSLTINAPVLITTTTLPAWTQNFAGYLQPVVATGGTGALTYSLLTGTIPTGLTLNSATGVLSGTPSAVGTFAFTVKATDTIGASDDQAYSVVINAPVDITTTTVPNGTSGTSYNQSIATVGGTGAKTISVASGTLPAGLNLVGATITGTPTATGTSVFILRATDTVGAFDEQAYSITINSTLNITPASLADWTVGKSGYSQAIAATGGTGASTFAVTVGTLPNGLTLDPNTGVLSGTPTVANTFNFTVTATDSVSATASKAYTVVINPAIVVTPESLPNATQNQLNYSQTLGTTGGTGAKTFAVTSGNLPTGMNLNSTTGILSGTPTVANTFNFTVTATDSVGSTGAKDYTIIVGAAVNITTATLSNWTQNFAGYSQQVVANGGTGALTYTVASGALPNGLNLNPANGAVTGTPTAVGTFAFTIRATDTLGAFAAQNFAVTISTPLNITPTTLPNGFSSQQYQQFILASGGTGTHVMSLSNVVNNFANIGINIIGDIVQVFGQSDVAGSISFTVTATDTVGATSSRDYTVNFV